MKIYEKVDEKFCLFVRKLNFRVIQIYWNFLFSCFNERVQLNSGFDLKRLWIKIIYENENCDQEEDDEQDEKEGEKMRKRKKSRGRKKTLAKWSSRRRKSMELHVDEGEEDEKRVRRIQMMRKEEEEKEEWIWKRDRKREEFWELSHSLIFIIFVFFWFFSSSWSFFRIFFYNFFLLNRNETFFSTVESVSNTFLIFHVIMKMANLQLRNNQLLIFMQI